MRPTAVGLVVLVATALCSGTAAAQTQTTTPPANLVVPNYNTVPVGPFGGLEGIAYAARVDDPSAAWFNPAGLARQQSPQISGSAGLFSRTTVTPEALASRGGSLQQLPNFVGFTFTPRKNLTIGASLLSNNAWSQNTNSELITTLPDGQERFSYSADSQFERRVLAVSAGYLWKDGWRFGGGFAVSLMDLSLTESASDRIGDGTGLRSLLVTSRVSTFALQLRAQAGAQYDHGSWRFGAAIRTPGANIYRTAEIGLDGVLSASPGSSGASLFDSNARLEYHMPWEFQGGVGYVGKRFQVEVDLQAYNGVDVYPLVASGQPIVLYGDKGAGVPPSIAMLPFNGLISESKSVANVGVGGQYQLFKSRHLLLHAGVATDRSPVGAADTVFSEVDLTSWTLGASGTLGKFQFSLGLNRQTGTIDNFALRNVVDGTVVQTKADVRMTGFVYQLAYQF